MKKTEVVQIILCAGMILSLHPGFLYGQPRDFDDDRLSLPETGVTEIGRDHRKKSAIRRLKREVKYVAGRDDKWFTPDDRVYRYYPVQYDKEGRMVKKSCFDLGADGRAFTKDDVLVDYQAFHYDDEGRVTKEITYDGKKKIKFTTIPEYNNAGKKIKSVRHDQTGKEMSVTEYLYDADGILEKDVEYVDSRMVKYHLFHHDHEKQYGRVIEFTAEDGSIGPDGKWFTKDDTVSAAKECFYNPDYTKASEKKYIESGTDKKWFTKDDEMQYYQVFEYETVGER